MKLVFILLSMSLGAVMCEMTDFEIENGGLDEALSRSKKTNDPYSAAASSVRYSCVTGNRCGYFKPCCYGYKCEGWKGTNKQGICRKMNIPSNGAVLSEFTSEHGKICKDPSYTKIENKPNDLKLQTNGRVDNGKNNLRDCLSGCASNAECNFANFELTVSFGSWNCFHWYYCKTKASKTGGILFTKILPPGVIVQPTEEPSRIGTTQYNFEGESHYTCSGQKIFESIWLLEQDCKDRCSVNSDCGTYMLKPRSGSKFICSLWSICTQGYHSNSKYSKYTKVGFEKHSECTSYLDRNNGRVTGNRRCCKFSKRDNGRCRLEAVKITWPGPYDP